MVKSLGAGLVAVMLAADSNSADAVEEAAWRLLSSLGKVELRHYDAVVQARTPTSPGAGATGGFRTLAGYIFGDNAADLEIAMTAPVERTLAGRDNYMAFFMPADYGMASLPEPDDGNVSLHPVPARTVAAIRFPGWAREKIVREKTGELLAILADHGIEIRGEPSLAQYNPPWTPPWMRRNEIMVEVEAPARSSGSSPRKGAAAPG